MKKITLLATALFCSILLSAQVPDLKARYKQIADKPSEGMLAVMNSNYKWGFVDEKTGTEVVAPKYDDASGFFEGLCAVSVNDRFGFIDKTGKEVIPLIYGDSKHVFSHGIAAVNKGAIRDRIMGLHGGVWGFINKEGKEVIPFKFDQIDPFYDEFIAVRVGGYWGFIDKTGKETVKPIYLAVHNFSENYATGRRVIKPEEKDSAAIKAGKYVSTEGWTFFDKTGREMIKPQYNYAGYFKDGLLNVTMLPAQYQPEKHGFIDKTGKVVIELKYDGSYDFGDGLAPVFSREENKWGYINAKGKLVIPFKYSTAYSFKNGVAKVKLDKVDYTVDKNGKETIAATH
jgi:hypothetical protein